MTSPSARSKLGSTSETSSWALSTVSTPSTDGSFAERVSASCSAWEKPLESAGLSQASKVPSVCLEQGWQSVLVPLSSALPRCWEQASLRTV